MTVFVAARSGARRVPDRTASIEQRDLLALADAVREAARPEPPRDPADDGRGTRRGHLRVLPDLH